MICSLAAQYTSMLTIPPHLNFYRLKIPNDSATNEGAWVGQFHQFGPYFTTPTLAGLRPLIDFKTNANLIIPSHTNRNPENLVKIGPVLSEFTCLKIDH